MYDSDDDGDVAMGPTVAELSDDDGYVSPEFELPSDSEGSEDEQPPSKKAKQNPASTTLEEEEELALKMLRSRR